MKPSILYVDHEQNNIDLFEKTFGSEFSIKACHSGQEGLKLLEKEGENIPLLIVGQSIPGLTGTELCERAAQLYPQMVRMALTAYTAPASLLDAINRGHVHDYIVKPWKKEDLHPIIEKAFDDHQKRKGRLKELEMRAAKSEELEREIREIYDSDAIIGASSSLKSTMATIKKAAPTDSTILILGETGTGKEVLARAVHDLSLRKNALFVPVHCASLSKSLMESELFGHEKGSFTGADHARMGRFESANEGTIFLDEIGELTEEIQVKLLRVLQEKEIHRVGGNRSIPTDVRLVAATHRNLEKMVRDGTFREDLFYRLNVIAIQVPPLRDRKEDIPVLANYFLKKYAAKLGKRLTLSQETLEYLSRYDWPGNVRELENILERAVILGEGPLIEPADFNLNIDEVLRVEKVDMGKILANESVRFKAQESEVRELSDLLIKTKGNIAEAARAMGVPRTTLFHRLRKYRLV